MPVARTGFPSPSRAARRAGPAALALALALGLSLAVPGATAQETDGPIPPLDIPLAVDPVPPAETDGAFPLDPALPDPATSYAPQETVPQPVLPDLPLDQAVPVKPRLALTARLTEDGGALASGLVWRVFSSIPGPDGELPLVAEATGGNASFEVPEGIYFVYCGFGYAGTTDRVEVRGQLVEKPVILNAGGLRLRAAAETRLLQPEDDVRFDIYSLDTDDRGERKIVARDIRPEELVRLSADTYHVVSRYGEVNAQTRGDVEVKAGKLTEVTLFQRAAEVTLKLVGTPGGEAIADTRWSVLTPGGDIVTEGVGAFPSFVLAAGEYTVIARHDEKVYQRDFDVETGRDAEVEVLAAP